MNNTLNYTDVKAEAITFKHFKEFILVNHDDKPLLIQTPYGLKLVWNAQKR